VIIVEIQCLGVWNAQMRPPAQNALQTLHSMLEFQNAISAVTSILNVLSAIQPLAPNAQ
jgi:hypothetical protein